MPIYHCHKPVFRPKMAIFRRAGMREGGRVATPTSFSIFDSYDMKSLWFKFGHWISLLASNWQDFKLRGLQFYFIKQLKNRYFEASEDII
jgi:hypothetical protein